MHGCMHACIHTYIHTYMHACWLAAYTHANMHTCMHAHIHTHTQWEDESFILYIRDVESPGELSLLLFDHDIITRSEPQKTDRDRDRKLDRYLPNR